ncbi:MAG: hypothetical protein OXC48_06010, partial [Endozoicomonadaceae bacterium]|nr:hypothetical protein [Endozoicomonadaceae bacterium]
MAAPSTPRISTNSLNNMTKSTKTAESNSKLSKVVDFLNRVRELMRAFLNHPITKALLSTALVGGLIAVTVLQLINPAFLAAFVTLAAVTVLQLISPTALAAFVTLAAAAGVALTIHGFFNKVIDGFKPDEPKGNNSGPNKNHQFNEEQNEVWRQVIKDNTRVIKDNTRVMEKLLL